ncbi:MAG: hypothetical protein JXA25_17065 [Anaerolineales bacterium]|nr:hypothetical protein [Anaerolineales bacterium]
MKCLTCNTIMEIEDRFCAQCGTMRPLLPHHFARAEGEFTRFRSEFLSGVIDQAAFIHAVKELTIQDETGSFWCIGVQSGQWYRYEENSWVPADPPVESTSL